jgi:hypothetical protein
MSIGQSNDKGRVGTTITCEQYHPISSQERGQPGVAMSTFKQLYVLYTDYGDNPVYIRLINEAKYDELKLGPLEDDRLYCSRIHSDSTRENDPIIEITVITEGPLNQEQATRIDQEVSNWLMDKGHMPKR